MSQEQINEQALGLNKIIEESASSVYRLLSKRGKKIYFPKKGIINQSAQAKKMGINATIGQAFEDDGKPMVIKSIVDSINLPPELVVTYSPSSGQMNIRQKWQEMMRQKNPSLANVMISLPIVTSALTHGLSVCAYLFVDDGDEILIPDLYWENYDLIFGNGYNARITNYKFFDGEHLDLVSLENALNNGKIGKKILLLNFPNNPAGYTPTKDEAKEITAIIKRAADKGNDVLVLVDDAYFGLEYEPNIITESLFSYLAGLHENVLAVKFDGATKEDYVWGLRIGFITFSTKCDNPEMYAAMEQKFAGAIRGNISNCSTLAQSLLFNAYSSPTYKAEKQAKYEILKSRYNTIKQILKEKTEYEQYFHALPYNSGYFMCIQLHNCDAEDLRKELIEHYDTGVIAMGGVIRIAFSCVKNDLLPKLFDNIYNAAKAIAK